MKTLLVMLCVIGVALARQQTPVFLWGASSAVKPALHTVSTAEFSEIVAPLLKDHMIVAFQEESLSSSDFLCANAETEQSCYAHLQGVSQKTYYASVENPEEALRSISSEREYNIVGENGRLETAVKCAANKVVFVGFNKAEGQRGDALEAHDAAIASISKQFDCPTVYLYMSAPAPAPALQSEGAAKKRTRREVPYNAATVGGTIFRHTNKFLIFWYSLSVTVDKKTEALTISSMTVTEKNSTDLGVTLTATNGQALTFDVALVSGYYYMRDLTYNKIVFRTKNVNAQPAFSYYCGNLTLCSTTNCDSTLQWNSLQFQAPFNSKTKDDFIFGDSWNCVGFFSSPLLAGLFVVAIMLAILFVGICWMMDVNTMDRFDDPKGKTITVNAGE